MLIRSVHIFIIGLLALPGLAAAAGVVQLPATNPTNQTSCFDTDGNIRDCAGTGEDGEKRAGVAWPTPRFDVKNDGTVKDKLTGLTWSRHANAPSRALPDSAKNFCPNAETEMIWLDALDFIKCLNTKTTANPNGHAGSKDWRLPNSNELESLLNAGFAENSAYLNANGFGFGAGLPSQVQAGQYWTSTSDARDLPGQSAAAAWEIDLFTGESPVSSILKNEKKNRVWPVRGASTEQPQLWRTGQTLCFDDVGDIRACTGTGEDGENLAAGAAWPAPRFQTNTGATFALDRLTGLVWTTATMSPGPSSDPPVCNTGTDLTWQEALDHVACLNTNAYLGRSDWRLPNRKELRSLADYSKGWPALPAGHPFSDQDGLTYWSSTTNASAPKDAWVISVLDGSLSSAVKAGTLPAWPVSGPDLVLPTLTITQGNMTTRVASHTISGTVEAGAAVKVSVNGGTPVAASVTGTTWSFTINPLAAGVNTVNVTAADFSENLSTVSISITLDAVAPVLAINQGNMTTNVASHTISGTVEAGAAVKVSVNGGTPVAASVTGTTWSFTINPLAAGVNTVNVTAADILGNISTVSVSITLDTMAPALAINQGNMTTNVASQTISGTVEAGAAVKVSVNGGTPATASVTGTNWSFIINPLAEGVNTVNVTAADISGNISTASVSITLDTVATAISINPVAARSNKKNHTISGTFEAGATVVVKNGATTLPVTVNGTSWSCPVAGLAAGANNITVTATDAAGNVATQTASISIVVPDGIVTGGSAVSISDALKTLRMAVGIISPSDDDLLRGDVVPPGEPDDKIDISDVLLILRKVIGIGSF